MTDPFKTTIATNEEDQAYLQLAHGKWMKRKSRTRTIVVVFIHRNGARRHRMISPGQFRPAMMRIGESAHQLATFLPGGDVWIESGMSSPSPWYEEFCKQWEIPA